jgi:hypothetical protein
MPERLLGNLQVGKGAVASFVSAETRGISNWVAAREHSSRGRSSMRFQTCHQPHPTLRSTNRLFLEDASVHINSAPNGWQVIRRPFGRRQFTTHPRRDSQASDSLQRIGFGRLEFRTTKVRSFWGGLSTVLPLNPAAVSVSETPILFLARAGQSPPNSLECRSGGCL